MRPITPAMLWLYLMYCVEDHATLAEFEEAAPVVDRGFDEETFQIIKQADLKPAIVDEGDNEINATDAIDLVKYTLKAIDDGYRILVWSGDNSEVLVVGYRPTQLTVAD